VRGLLNAGRKRGRWAEQEEWDDFWCYVGVEFWKDCERKARKKFRV